MALPVSPQSRSACSVQIYLLNAEDGIPGRFWEQRSQPVLRGPGSGKRIVPRLPSSPPGALIVRLAPCSWEDFSLAFPTDQSHAGRRTGTAEAASELRMPCSHRSASRLLLIRIGIYPPNGKVPLPPV